MFCLIMPSFPQFYLWQNNRNYLLLIKLLGLAAIRLGLESIKQTTACELPLSRSLHDDEGTSPTTTKLEHKRGKEKIGCPRDIQFSPGKIVYYWFPEKLTTFTSRKLENKENEKFNATIMFSSQKIKSRKSFITCKIIFSMF